MKNVIAPILISTLPGISKIVCLDETESTQARRASWPRKARKDAGAAETQTGGRASWTARGVRARRPLYDAPSRRKPGSFLPELSVLSGEAVAETLTELTGLRPASSFPTTFTPGIRAAARAEDLRILAESSPRPPVCWLFGVGVNLNNTVKLDTAVSVI